MPDWCQLKAQCYSHGPGTKPRVAPSGSRWNHILLEGSLQVTIIQVSWSLIHSFQIMSFILKYYLSVQLTQYLLDLLTFLIHKHIFTYYFIHHSGHTVLLH